MKSLRITWLTIMVITVLCVYIIIYSDMHSFQNKLSLELSESLLCLNDKDYRHKNHSFIKTKEEMELTKLTPIIDPVKCRDETKIAILVISAAQVGDAQQTRDLLRNTWVSEARHQHNISVYFLLGLSREQSVNKKLREEAQKYQDIVQFNFVDNYMNLTLKTIAMLRWSRRKCSSTKFIMKVDDDVIVNIERLLSSIKTFKSGITGYRVTQVKRKFCENGKGCIPEKFYPATKLVLPPYVYGGACIISGDVIQKLINANDKYHGYYLEIEDLFLTGIIAEEAGVQSYYNPDLLFSFSCDLKYLWQMSSLIALVDCNSNEELSNFLYSWKYAPKHPTYFIFLIIIACSIIIFCFCITITKVFTINSVGNSESTAYSYRTLNTQCSTEELL